MKSEKEIRDVLGELIESVLDSEDTDFWFSPDDTEDQCLEAGQRRGAVKMLRWVVEEGKETPDAP